MIAASSSARLAAVASLASEPISRIVSIRFDFADDLDEPRVADLVDRLRGAVDRVLRRGVGGEEREDTPLDVVLQHRQFEPVRRQDVGHPYRAAARPGDYRDAVAARQPTEREGGRDIEHMVEILAADDAVVTKDRIVDIAGLRQCAGMRRSGTPPGGRSADLGDDQRLAGIRGFVRNRAEPFRAADPFEIEEENVGATLVEPPIDVVVRLQDSLVAGADLMREMQLPVAAAAEKRESQRPTLAADRDRPPLADGGQQTPAGVMEDRAEGSDERPQRIDDALGVGTADEDAVAFGDPAQLDIACACGLVALFGKARADHDGGPDSSQTALLEGLDDMRRRHQDDREIHRLGQRRDRRIGPQPQHLALAAGHRKDPAVIAMADQRVRQPAAQGLGIGRSADNGNAVR